MAELPTGTVTFLFTDIEGSTRLLHELDGSQATKALRNRWLCSARSHSSRAIAAEGWRCSRRAPSWPKKSRISDAEELLREAVDLALEFGDRIGLSWYLSQYALVLLHQSRPGEAGRLWGAVETAAAFVPGGPWPRDIEQLQREVFALADAAFETGRAAGCSLSLEEAASWMCSLD